MKPFVKVIHPRNLLLLSLKPLQCCNHCLRIGVPPSQERVSDISKTSKLMISSHQKVGSQHEKKDWTSRWFCFGTLLWRCCTDKPWFDIFFLHTRYFACMGTKNQSACLVFLETQLQSKYIVHLPGMLTCAVQAGDICWHACCTKTFLLGIDADFSQKGQPNPGLHVKW